VVADDYTNVEYITVEIAYEALHIRFRASEELVCDFGNALAEFPSRNQRGCVQRIFDAGGCVGDFGVRSQATQQIKDVAVVQSLRKRGDVDDLRYGAKDVYPSENQICHFPNYNSKVKGSSGRQG
jgi:hypothetical protein